MLKVRIWALLLIIISGLIGWFVYVSEVNPDSARKFKLGLDLDGGTHLTYKADTSAVAPADVSGAMDSLRRTIERRINIFGVSEPIIQTESGSFFGEVQNRLIVELPGVEDIDEAVKMIGQTPLLEFKLLTEDPKILAVLNSASTTAEQFEKIADKIYVSTGLTGAQLKRANLAFDQYTNQAMVSVEFNDGGKQLLAKVTKENIGKPMAIFLDGESISMPVIRDEIITGTAQISGDFTRDEALKLVQSLNFGALPIPIELIETQTIGATLGHDTLNSGVKALFWALIAIFVFLIAFYRLAGFVASVSLVIYTIVMLAMFKMIPVTLTSSGLAGFVLSLGMAVDANILVFERLREELRNGLSLFEAIKESRKRAWSSIRDGNLSSLISAAVLFWVSGTPVVAGFALVFMIGVVASWITAVFASELLLLAVSSKKVGSKLQAFFIKK